MCRVAVKNGSLNKSIVAWNRFNLLEKTEGVQIEATFDHSNDECRLERVQESLHIKVTHLTSNQAYFDAMPGSAHQTKKFIGWKSKHAWWLVHVFEIPAKPTTTLKTQIMAQWSDKVPRIKRQANWITNPLERDRTDDRGAVNSEETRERRNDWRIEISCPQTTTTCLSDWSTRRQNKKNE